MKNKVIRIDGEQEDKPLELTHHLDREYGWSEELSDKPEVFEKIVYLGRDHNDGDIFACYDEGFIHIHKGHLNSGRW